jgi:hypothetical protein
LKGTDFQNLGLELSMLTAGSKIRSTREKTRALARKTQLANMPWTEATKEWKLDKGYKSEDVVWLKPGEMPKVGKKAPETLETWTFQDKNNPENTQQVRKDDLRKLASLNANPRWKRVTTPPAAKRPWEPMDIEEIKRRKLNVLNKYIIGPDDEVRLVEKHDPRTYTFQDMNPKSPTYRDQKEVGAEDGFELARLREDPNWNLVKTPAALKRGTIPLTEENTAVGAEHEEWRGYYKEAIGRGDFPLINEETNKPSLDKFTAAAKKKTVPLTSDNTQYGAIHHQWKGYYEKAIGRGDIPVINEETGKPSLDKFTPEKKYRRLLKPSEVSKYADEIKRQGPLATAWISNQGLEFTYRPRSKSKTYFNTRNSSTLQGDPDDPSFMAQMAGDGDWVDIDLQFAKDDITGGQKLRVAQGFSNIDFADNLVKKMQATIARNEKPTTGIGGRIQYTYQNAQEMVKDIAATTGLFSEVRRDLEKRLARGDIESNIQPQLRAGFNKDLPLMELYEHALVYAYALANKQSSGRLNRQDLDRAEKQIKITKWGESQQNVIASLEGISELLAARRQGYTDLANELWPTRKGFQSEDTGKPLPLMRVENGRLVPVEQK